MATIGGVQCDLLRGTIGPLSERTDTWEVPGLDGYGAQRMGLGDAAFKLTAVRFGSQATLTAWQTALKALVGSVVTIVDDLGLTHTYCLLTSVDTMSVTASAWAAGSLTDRRGQIAIQGVKTG